MGIRRDDIENYYMMRGKQDFTLHNFAETLKYKLYVNYSNKDLERIDKLLQIYVERVYGREDRYKSMFIKNKEDYQELEMGLAWDGIYGISLQKGVINQLKYVSKDEIYDYYDYSKERLTMYDLETLGIRDKGRRIKESIVQSKYRECVIDLYRKVNYFCGYEKAEEIVNNYTSNYFRLMEEEYGIKLNWFEKNKLKVIYKARVGKVKHYYRKDKLRGITDTVYD